MVYILLKNKAIVIFERKKNTILATQQRGEFSPTKALIELKKPSSKYNFSEIIIYKKIQSVPEKNLNYRVLLFKTF